MLELPHVDLLLRRVLLLLTAQEAELLLLLLLLWSAAKAVPLLQQQRLPVPRRVRELLPSAVLLQSVQRGAPALLVRLRLPVPQVLLCHMLHPSVLLVFMR